MKKLVLEVLTTKWGKLLRVKEQTHITHKFGNNEGNIFDASNGFYLGSGDVPEIMDDGLYVLGYDISENNKVRVIPSDEWLAKCRVAVREYNKYFADKKKEVKPEDDVEVIE